MRRGTPGTSPPREPVLRAGLFFGLGIPDSRGTRVRVDDRGAVLVQRQEGEPTELAAPGAVTKITVVGPDRLRPRRFTPAARRGIVVLWSGSELLAALNLTELGADRPYPDDATFRAVVGLDAFAEALGLAVEPPTDDEVRRTQQLHQRDLLPLHDPGNHLWWTAWLAAVALGCAFLTWPAVAAGLGWFAVMLAFAVTTPPVLLLRRRRRRLMELLTTPLEPDGRDVLRPDPPHELRTGQLVDTEVQVGDRDIVVRSGGKEWWLPGPLAGGITGATLSSDALVLTDRHDRAYLALDPLVWGGRTEALLGSLERHQVRVARTPLPDARMAELIGGRHEAGRWVVPRAHEDASDSNVAAALPHLAVLVLGVGCAALAVSDFPLGLVAVACWAVLQGLAVQGWLPRSRWIRRQRSAAPGTDGPNPHTTGAVR